METNEADLDLETTRNAIADDDLHAIYHANQVDDLDSAWRTIESLQDQIDELYKLLIDHICER